MQLNLLHDTERRLCLSITACTFHLAIVTHSGQFCSLIAFHESGIRC